RVSSDQNDHFSSKNESYSFRSSAKVASSLLAAIQPVIALPVAIRGGNCHDEDVARVACDLWLRRLQLHCFCRRPIWHYSRWQVAGRRLYDRQGCFLPLHRRRQI